MEEEKRIGERIYKLASELFPICRSITGNGNRETLKILQREIPGLNFREIPTGTSCFDWTVPDEWNIQDAYIADPEGNKIIDFKKNNLHILGYSEPVDTVLPFDELKKHLYSDPSKPDAIPYRTSYYYKRWGFCLPHSQLQELKPGMYHVHIDSTLAPGSMTYGELIIPGQSEKEVFLSTYICHPSMAINEISGIVVTAFAAKWILSLGRPQKSYRILFIPETIGSICYLSQHLGEMQRKLIAGFNVTCIGGDRGYSLIKSRAENSLADRVALHVIKNISNDYKIYPFLKSGSDERQYCSPGVDLPVVSLMRRKYAEYPEYHTSMDNMDLISPSGLYGGYRFLKLCIECLENNQRLKATAICQPQLGKRGLYPNLSTASLESWHRRLVDLLAYADGSELLEIANTLDVPIWDLYDVVEKLKSENLIESESLI